MTAAPASPAATRLPPNVEGALWMVASAVCYTAMTTLVKFLGNDYSPALQTFYRQAAGLLVLLPFIARDWRGAFRTSRPGILIFRSAAGTVGMILAFYSFQTLPLTDANALSFTRTLWLVPLAAFVLKERVGPLRLAAAAAGFIGVMIMLRPDGHTPLGAGQMAALGSSFLFALTIAGMKVMTRDHSAMTLVTYSAVLGLVLAIPPALFVWKWPTPVDLALLAAMGAVGTATQTCYIRGMAVGDAGAMAPIDYIRLVFSAAVGFALFHEVPTLWTLVGAAVVVASTLFITWRETQVARQARRAAAASSDA